ncbi:MAG: discoidin domain-containing protein [Victivallales bacterium]|nr:discoidin domain-containing protein [Victivallales bacterium]
MISDGQSKVLFSEVSAELGKVLQAEITLKEGGGWIILKKQLAQDPSSDSILSFKIKSDADFDLETNFVKIDGSVHNKRTSLKNKYKEWTDVKISFTDIPYGWKVKRNSEDGAEIQLGFSGKGKGNVQLKDFEIGKKSSLMSVSKWHIISERNSSLKLSLAEPDVFKAEFKLASQHGWAMAGFSLQTDADDSMPVLFDVKTDFTGDLEVKFIDKDGTVHCRKIKVGKNPEQWQRIVVYKSDCDMKWKVGVQKSAEIQIGFSGNGQGSALLRGIRFVANGTPSTAKSFLDPSRNMAGTGFRQRRDAKLVPEDQLVFEWLKANQDTASQEKDLLASMEGNQGSTFNNALAAMAFILKGSKLRAERIIDVYSNAMDKDNNDSTAQNFYYQGEARGFYQYADLSKKKGGGYVRLGECDRWMGDMAWLLLAVKYYEKTYSSNRYDKLSTALLQLLESWFVDTGNGTGYVAHGWRKGDKYLHEKDGHIEGNIDAYAAFLACGKNDYALKIKKWLTGKLKDRENLPLDVYSWRVLAFGSECAQLLNIPEFDLRYRKCVKSGNREVCGFFPFPDENSSNIWLDGNGHMACGYLIYGDIERGNFYANQYDQMIIERTINGKKVHALPYALRKEGIYSWVDPEKAALSPAVWYVFAKNSFNPFTFKSGRRQLRVSASSGNGEYPPDAAFDGNMKTRWASGSSDIEWLQIEFPEARYLCGMTIFWETAYSMKYDILTSNDGEHWRKVAGIDDGDGGSDKIYFKGHFARFVRIATRKRGTGWGNSIWDLTLSGLSEEPEIKVSSTGKTSNGEYVVDGRADTFWESGTNLSDSCEIDLAEQEQMGGIVLRWGKSFPDSYIIETSLDRQSWTKVANRKMTNGKTDIIYFIPRAMRYVRLTCNNSSPRSIELAEIEFKRDDEAASPLRLYKAVAQEYPEGYFPKWMYAKQEYWNIAGVEKGLEECLVSENATIEPYSKAFTVMPYIYIEDKLISAMDCKVSQELVKDYYPMPLVNWQRKEINLKTAVWAAGTPECAATYITYTIKNTGNKTIKGKFYLAIRPIQLNPPWQHGGMSPIREIRFDRKNGVLKVNGKNVLYTFNPAEFGAVKLPENDVIAYVKSGILPDNEELKDESGLISGALEYKFQIPPQSEKTIYSLTPLTDNFNIDGISYGSFAESKKSTCAYWEEKLNRIKIDIPQKEIVNALRANLAYVLINADKNSLHPGARAYDRSWIRDGSIMSQALLDTRNFDEVKEYLEWVKSCQMDNGRVPCMLELNGKMPGWSGGWCEWDGQGAYVFAVTSYYRFTKDKQFLDEMFPSVIKALEFLKQLRAKRLTDKYKGTVYYGIIPESNSHEGYFPAQHSLWDDFWALKGWKDGQMLAKAAGEKQHVPWMENEEHELRKNLLRNIKVLQRERKIRNIPGCFEKADFDATSTAIAVWPAFELEFLPRESLDYTLDTYYDNTLMPRYKKLTSSYTPYELRTANAYLIMGQRKKTLSMINYFLRDMRPRKWLHWGEVVHADINTPSYIGDMPHSWIGAIAINVIRNLFVYEQNNKDLVFGAGIDPAWLDSSNAISAENMPTYFGSVGFKMRKKGRVVTTVFSGKVKGVNNIYLVSPLDSPIKSAKINGRNADISENRIVVTTFPAEVVIKY